MRREECIYGLVILEVDACGRDITYVIGMEVSRQRCHSSVVVKVDNSASN